MGIEQIRVIIIEDEKPSARLLQRKLQRIGINPVEMLHSVQESIAWLSESQHPDLIFLDVQLSDGLSFEIFESVQISSSIIFTTAYDEYALKAFKLNSIDYLLKPIEEDELKAAVDKYRNRKFSNESISVDADNLRKMLFGASPNYKKRFTIRIGHHLKMIAVEDIECFYSENKATYIHTTDNRDYLIDAALDSVCEELDPQDFFRVSRKHIVRLSAIKEITLYSNSRLKVVLPTYNAEEVIVSREKVSHFRQWLE